jgi:hypothetical protein
MMASFSFEFLTFSKEKMKQLRAMEMPKRVLLATKHACEADTPINGVQAKALRLPEVDDSMVFFVESFDLAHVEEMCANPDVKVWNSGMNAILDGDLDISIKYKK